MCKSMLDLDRSPNKYNSTYSDWPLVTREVKWHKNYYTKM